MRITFISHYADLYGANRSLLSLIDGLLAYQVRPTVICRSSGPITEELTKRNIPFCVFPFEWWLLPQQPLHILKGMIRFLHNVMLLPSMIWQLKQWQPDIIYTNSSVTPIGALLAKLMRKPHVWHIREFGKSDYNLNHDLGEFFFRYWINQATVVIAVSRSIKDKVLKGIRSRIHVIYNGVISMGELEKLAGSAPGPKSKKEVFTFVMAGLIHPPKGQKEAIETLALLHRKHIDVELLIAGTGNDDYVRQLQTLARDLGVAPHVHFLGFFDDIYSVYRRADAVLMCSRFEAMGRVTAEAMAAGKPVIGYNSAGTAEIIDHGKTGLLYDGGHKSLAVCMENLIKNREWALDLGRHAREKVKKEFTVEIYAERVFKVLKTVAHNGTG